MDFEEEGREETGWKLVHADVFRPPAHANLLSALVGTGSQLFCACASMLVFATFGDDSSKAPACSCGSICLLSAVAAGFVSPAHRGGLMTAMLLCFVLMGTFSG